MTISDDTSRIVSAERNNNKMDYYHLVAESTGYIQGRAKNRLRLN